MIPRIPINKLLDTRTLSAGIFVTTGIYRTYKDVKNASHKYKKKFLIKMKKAMDLHEAASGGR